MCKYFAIQIPIAFKVLTFVTEMVEDDDEQENGGTEDESLRGKRTFRY